MPFDTAQFVPASELPLLSPLFVKAAAWPELWDTLALPLPDEPGFPGEPAIADLEYLITTWLHPDLRPRSPRAAMGLCGHGRLTVRVGRSAAEWAEGAPARHERARALGGLPPSRIEGFASAQRHEEYPTLSFALQWEDPQTSLDPGALLHRLAEALAPEVYAEIEARRPHEHPVVHLPSSYAATVMLDMEGYGGIFPYLYLYATPERLLGIFQQIPHRSL